MIGRAGIISIGVGILVLVLIVAYDRVPKPTACFSELDCSGKLSKCVENLCVQCSVNADCTSGKFCNKKNGRCEERLKCENHKDCKNLVYKHCKRKTGKCVECLQNNNCPTGQYCVDNSCKTLGNCTTDADCTDPLAPYCFSGVCSSSSIQNNLL